MENILLFNSLTKQKEKFIPFDEKNVGMYSCGFTVYSHAHIGHLKRYVGDDVLKRVLNLAGYNVKHVHNVTDVGHLTSDSDTGEDKLEKGARLHKLTIYEVAQKFEKEFYDSLELLNIILPEVIQRATNEKAIEKQIEFIEILLKKGYAYIKDSAIYFDVAKLPDYNPFSAQKIADKITKRDDVEIDPEKKHQADFVLWMFIKGKYKDHEMRWDSPWGVGFPGWHIECSAISILNLGDKIDIHTGGIDHLEVHHPDEIAQNYGVVGRDVVKYWVHHNFLIVDGKKMSKSLNNFYTLEDIKAHGINLMALRYFILSAHYRSQINFTWDAINGVQTAYNRLLSHILKFSDAKANRDSKDFDDYYNLFKKELFNDINTPGALAIMWEVIQNDKLDVSVKKALITDFDKVLGLKLFEEKNEKYLENIPKSIRELVDKRLEAKKEKRYALADEIRYKIEQAGYTLEDLKDTTRVVKQN